MQRLGLFGGTFDPVHKGHLQVAQVSRRALNLDSVIFLPAATPPHKQGVPMASSKNRLGMLRRALAGQAGYRISLHDLNRKTPAYTVDTLHYFKKRYPRASFFFIMGSDSLVDFPRWKRASEILTMCRLAVVPRPSYKMTKVPALVRGHVDWINTQGLPVSSSRIRELVKQGPQVKRFLPPAVWRYIKDNSLYGYGG